MKLTIVLICLEFDEAALRTLHVIPEGVVVLVKCLKADPVYKKKGEERGSTTFIIQADTGIYDAMNQALQYVETKYVLYIGSNDMINSKAIKDLCEGFVSDHDAFVFGVKLNGRISKIENFGSIRFYHHQGTVIKTELYKRFGGFTTYEIHADLALLCKISSELGTNFSVLENSTSYLVDYDLGGTSNSGKYAWKSIAELFSIFSIYEQKLWRFGHLKALFRPIYYKVKSLVS